jgi:hypothetical protein
MSVTVVSVGSGVNDTEWVYEDVVFVVHATDEAHASALLSCLSSKRVRDGNSRGVSNTATTAGSIAEPPFAIRQIAAGRMDARGPPRLSSRALHLEQPLG